MAQDDKPLIFGLCIAFPIIAITSVILRFQARRIQRVKLGADDWTILAALILSVALSIDILLDSQLGNLGGHSKFNSNGSIAPDPQYRIFGQTTFALELLSWPALGLNKISVLLLYKRIFTGRTFGIVTWIGIGIVIAWTVAFQFSLLFSCWPIASHWDPTIPFKCVDRIKLFTIALATDVITDAGILALPSYNVWRLQMPTARKVAVLGIFLLGGLVTVTGIIRLHYVTRAYNALKNPRFTDVKYIYAPSFYWSVIETNVGVLSACLPTMRPLYRAYRLDSLMHKTSGSLRNLLSMTSSSSNKSNNNKSSSANSHSSVTTDSYRLHDTKGDSTRAYSPAAGHGKHHAHDPYTVDVDEDEEALASSNRRLVESV
ncbi:MAG: hypothetical protein M1816_007294 [Peltula sp. TS41687]|nr:MAG: hypothetical protein M1816_007294 [Peltula sp. TS41687]